LAEGYVVMKSLGPRQLKGRAAPEEVYEALGATAVRSRLQAAVARGLAGFVGRIAEMELLLQRFARADAGEGQVVAIVGEAGLGKSRLLYEFRQLPQVQNWLVLESTSASYGTATSFLPLIELLKSYFEVDPNDAPAAIQEKVVSKLKSLDPGLSAHLPALLFLLDVPPEDESWNRLDPPQRRQRALDAIRVLLLVQSRIRPLLILFEDLQWIDAETQAFLDGFIDNLAKARILLVVNYRTEYQHGWARKTFYRDIRLEPLLPTSVDALLDSYLGTDPVLTPLKQLLIDRTEGNPFFLEESIRALIEMKFLDGELGAYRLLKTADTLHIPPSAQGILTARIDRLLPEDKRVLQAAAVVGKEVPFALLKALGDEAEERLRKSLDNLQSTEFLYQTALFPELEFTFRHALTQGVAYRSLVNERRRSLHAAIVDAIEAVYPDRLPERADRLAHHAFHGEVWHKAVTYSRQAALKALTRSANREALGLLEQAMAALKKLPDSHERKQLAIDLRFDMRLALMPLGEFTRTLDLLREAEVLASELDDQPRLGWVAGYLTNLLWEMGEQDRAVESGLRAMAQATRLGHPGIRDLSHRYLGRSYHAMGDYRRAVDVFLHAIDPPDDGSGQQQRAPSVLTRCFLVLSLAELGAFSQALAHGEQALRLAKAIDNPLNLIAVQCTLGRVYLRKGEFEQAVAPLEHSLSLCRSANIPLLFPFAASPLGAVYARIGRLSQAMPLLKQAAERAAAMRRMVDQPLWTYWLSQGTLHSGEIERAAEIAERALQLSVSYKERGSQGWVHRLLGDISAQVPERWTEAELQYQKGLAIAHELGMQPLQARCYLGLANLYQQLGQLDEARKAATASHQLCRDMELGIWREQASAALARTGSLTAG
jgi:tetratricopeptide (TPR) repeat protein